MALCTLQRPGPEDTHCRPDCGTPVQAAIDVHINHRFPFRDPECRDRRARHQAGVKEDGVVTAECCTGPGNEGQFVLSDSGSWLIGCSSAPVIARAGFFSGSSRRAFRTTSGPQAAYALRWPRGYPKRRRCSEWFCPGWCWTSFHVLCESRAGGLRRPALDERSAIFSDRAAMPWDFPGEPARCTRRSHPPCKTRKRRKPRLGPSQTAPGTSETLIRPLVPLPRLS